jgi:hypothetical protein
MSDRGSYGYHAQVDEYGDMIEKGIIDPAKVVRIALQDSRALRPASPNVTTKSSRFERVAQNRGPFLGHSSDAREDASLQTTELLVESLLITIKQTKKPLAGLGHRKRRSYDAWKTFKNGGESKRCSAR